MSVTWGPNGVEALSCKSCIGEGGVCMGSCASKAAYDKADAARSGSPRPFVQGEAFSDHVKIALVDFLEGRRTFDSLFAKKADCRGKNQ